MRPAQEIARLASTSFYSRISKPNQYRGAVKAVVLDWSGTTVDAHVLAPATAFVKTFQANGVSITMTEARAPMGKRKDVHIASILSDAQVQSRWENVKGRKPITDLDGADVKKLYEDFVDIQLKCLGDFATLIPGTAEATQYLQRDLGIKVGTTTGFTKAMSDVLLREAATQGYIPDSSVSGDEVLNNMGSRPAPFMLYQCLRDMGIWPIQSVVKVDDTVTGIEEGLNAGCWTVGVAGHSNYTNVESMDEWDAMNASEKEERIQSARDILTGAGGHYVIDSIAQLPLIVEEISQRLKSGETPSSVRNDN